jgi:hypothetical protein
MGPPLPTFKTFWRLFRGVCGLYINNFCIGVLSYILEVEKLFWSFFGFLVVVDQCCVVDICKDVNFRRISGGGLDIGLNARSDFKFVIRKEKV